MPFINGLASPSHIALVRIFVAYGSVLLGLFSLVWNVIGATRVEYRRKLKVVLWGDSGWDSSSSPDWLGIRSLPGSDNLLGSIREGFVPFPHTFVVRLRSGEASG